MFHIPCKPSLKSALKQAQMPIVKFCPVLSERLCLHTKYIFLAIDISKMICCQSILRENLI